MVEDAATTTTTSTEGAAVTTPAHRRSRRSALGGLLATPLALPGILSSASFASASAGPASAAELEAEVTSKVFFDFAVDARPVGRVVVGVFGRANPVAAARFVSLAVGVQGLSYKRTEINAVEYNEEDGVDSPIFIGDNGVKAFVIPGSTTPVEGIPGGATPESLLPELAARKLSHNRAGLVSLVVERGAPPPPPKERLVSMNGKFVTVTDPPPLGPNGTAFTVTVAAAAAAAGILDPTNVVVGTVLEGQEVAEYIAALPTVKDNSGSPFFVVAKNIGDKRAIVAEQAFGKPFAKVTVAKCGELSGVSGDDGGGAPPPTAALDAPSPAAAADQ